MKKTLTLLLAFLLCLSFCACAEQENVISEVEHASSKEDSKANSIESQECEHDYYCSKSTAATCMTPGSDVFVCKKCDKSYSERTPLADHVWEGGSCTEPQACKNCDAVKEALGHDWKKVSCEEPEECKVCGEKGKSDAGHSWKSATCKTPKTCKECGKTEGGTASHDWKSATCKAPKTCKDCGKTEGSTTSHNWKSATCTAPKTCKDCGTTSGSAAGHSWKSATCKAPKTCKTCGKTEGSKGSHNYSDGYCTVCSSKDPNFVKVYKAGEAWIVPGEWEFTVNNVSEHVLCNNNRNKNYGFEGMYGLMLNYTYKNLSSVELSIGYEDTFGSISVYDCESEKAEVYGNGIFCDHEKDAQNCMPGMKATAKHSYAVNNKSRSVTVYVTKTDSKGVKHTATFKVSVIPEPQEPEEDKLNGCTITVDTSLPKTINYYNYNGSISSSCQVTEISFEVSGDDLYIYMTGRKTYDANGSGQSSACKIGWKLYDANNYVVDDGTLYTNSLATGEGFLKASTTAYNVIVPGGSYRLVILNVN